MTRLPTGANPSDLFDDALLRARRNRFAANFNKHDFLQEKSAHFLSERLSDIRRDFTDTAIIGDNGGHAERLLRETRPDIHTLAFLDPVYLMRPKAPDSFDLIVSNLALQWINDLPEFLAKIRGLLKPEGLFIAALLGGDSLIELRQSLMAAETVVMGGASPRLHPSISPYDMTMLMQRAGFAMPVVDTERVRVDYGNFGSLLADLRAQGGNVLHARHKRPVPRAFWAAAAVDYGERFADAQGRLPVTLDIVFCAGWHPESR